MIDTSFDVFDSIKSQLSEKQTRTFSGPAPWTKKMAMKEGKYYLVRLLPYTKEGEEGKKKTIFTYVQYIFSDAETHRLTYVQSPSTFGQPCPFEKYNQAYRANHTKEENQAFGNKLRRSVGRYINALLIDTDDDTKPKKEGSKSPKERIGEVIALTVPNSLWGVIQSGLKGEFNDQLTEEAREFNESAPEVRLQRDMFNLNPSGINLRICVKHNDALGGYNDYSSSKFTFSKRDLKKSDDEIKAILEECTDLTMMNKKYTFEECEVLLRKGFLGVKDDAATSSSAIEEETEEDEIPTFTSTTSQPRKEDIPVAEPSRTIPDSGNDNDLADMDDFLASLPDDL